MKQRLSGFKFDITVRCGVPRSLQAPERYARTRHTPNICAPLAQVTANAGLFSINVNQQVIAISLFIDSDPEYSI